MNCTHWDFLKHTQKYVMYFELEGEEVNVSSMMYLHMNTLINWYEAREGNKRLITKDLRGVFTLSQFHISGNLHQMMVPLQEAKEIVDDFCTKYEELLCIAP